MKTAETGARPTTARSWLQSVIAVAILATPLALQAQGYRGEPKVMTDRGSWQTTLLGRDIHGSPVDLLVAGEPNPAAVFLYDTLLDLTWYNPSFEDNPLFMGWGAAMEWTRDLDVGGFTGWRLPHVVDIGSDGCNYNPRGGTDCGYNVRILGDNGEHLSELAHLYHVTLGNYAVYQPGTEIKVENDAWGLWNSGPFQKLYQSYYWLDTGHFKNPLWAWYFFFYEGFQEDTRPRNLAAFVLAVRPGDVLSPVPEPAQWLMMLAGIGLVVGAAGAQRRRR